MTRDDYLDVAMRVLGLYAWVQAALAAVQGLASVPRIFVSLSAPSDPHPESMPLSGILGGLAFSAIKAFLLNYPMAHHSK